MTPTLPIAPGPAILVTGGAGYIGSHVCKALAAAGFTPVVYDNLCRGHAWAVRWGPLEIGDIGDRARLGAVIRQYAPLAVIHLAAFAYVGEGEAHPDLYYDNNVTRSLAMIETIVAHDIQHVIFSSSCATYGIPASLPIVETMPPEPVNVYGTTKLMLELVLASYARRNRLHYCALRYFNAAGADADGEIGELHNPEPHVVPLLLAACERPETTFQIFGTDYPTDDGTCIRDYIHVSDLATAHVLALQHLIGRKQSAVFNLGTGSGVSVRQLIDIAEAVTGRKIKTLAQPRRQGDPPVLIASADKAHRILGWQPQWRDPRDIVASAWAWHTGPLRGLAASSISPAAGTGP